MDVSLSRRLLIALLTPAVLLVIGGGLLAFQLSRMTEDRTWLEHSQEVLAVGLEARSLIVDRESAVRGYMLTGDRQFLEPYHAADPELALEQLADLTGDNPAQSRRVAEVTKRLDEWNRLFDGMLDQGADLDPYRTPEAMLARKERMDIVRRELGEFLTEEIALRASRNTKADASTDTTRNGLAAVFIALAVSIVALSRGQLGSITRTYDAALADQKVAGDKMQREEWVASGIVALNEALRGELDVEQVIKRSLRTVAQRVDADVGAGFVASSEGWSQRASHGFEQATPLSLPRGDGLLGRSADVAQTLWMHDAPHGYLRVRSGLGETTPVHVVVVPAVVEGRVSALLELAFLGDVPERTREYLDRLREPLGATVRAAEFRSGLRGALEREQRQSEELQTQQEELRVANEELEQQTNAVRAAHAALEERQQALEEANAGLEAQTLELRRAERELSAKATELARASQYKSEFLANMSHELRTPLNSTLILAKLLADNGPGTLTPDQIRFAETIHNAGNDLLALINDILDLAKIEAGHMEARPSKSTVFALIDPVFRGFEPIAAERGLQLDFECDARDVPVFTDVQRVQQIVKNLVSNAIKFTEAGRVSIHASTRGDRLHVRVVDTGIGFSMDQAEVIFEAFRQADGTTSRKYGGTGLGLAISRDFARLLGGELTAQSVPGRGSTFHLELPTTITTGRPAHVPAQRGAAFVDTRAADRPAPTPAPATDGKTLLIIEDDPAFANILADLASELGYRPTIAETAEVAMQLATATPPRAILLDVRLPDQSGLGVLDALKRRPETRHIPVHVISSDDYAEQALALGAAGAITKPVSRDELVRAVRRLESFAQPSRRRLLLVEDDPVQREAVGHLLGGPDLEIVAVGDAAAAIAALREGTFDCMVTDLGLPDASGLELLQTIADDDSLAFPPVIVYTGRELSNDDQDRLRRLAPTIIVKGARSPERLLDEVSLFLHRVESALPADRQLMLRRARDQETGLVGRSILVVEDDVRNIFALTSALEPKGCKVIIARNGLEALEQLEHHRIDLVLMDIMMPQMDGLEATRRIRAMPQHARLPIIALTAKAMPDDRERCIAAGANDYITKPLVLDRLLSLVRVWLRPEARA